jgi:ribose 5-phosphate isomerase A
LSECFAAENPTMSEQTDPILEAIATRALTFVEDNAIVGLGSGRAATAFIRALGERHRAGLQVRGVPTSEGSANVAREYGIPLIGMDEAESIDVTVDGADEVDPQLDLIKGYGAALLRERIVAEASRMEIILVGEEKLVRHLGSRGIVPIEVVPFAAGFCARRLAGLGGRPQLRMKDGRAVVTDNGNHIIDCGVEPLADPRRFESDVRGIPGVVGTGLFLGIATLVLIGTPTGVRELHRSAK